jgi:hypothetical protein
MIPMFALALTAAAPAQCAPVDLTVAGNSKTFISKFARNSNGFSTTAANFGKAYAKACREGLLKAKPLVGAKSADRRHLFLVNAPEANVGSIYETGSRTVLEYHFDTGAPSADELHEAIYCAVHGSTAKEQEESGRCLPD